MVDANNYCGLHGNPVKSELVQPLCSIGDIWKSTLFDDYYFPSIGWSCNYDANNVPSFAVDPCEKFGAWSGLFCKVDESGGSSEITGINLNMNVVGINPTSTIKVMPDFKPFKDELQMLLMQYNQIQLPFPNSDFKELQKLTHLDLMGHLFTGGLDDDLFEYLPNLKYFDYSYIGNVFEEGNNVMATGTPFPSSFCETYTTPNQITADFSGVTFSECIPECARQQQITIGATNTWCDSNDDEDNVNNIIIGVVVGVVGMGIGVGLAWMASTQGWCGNGSKRAPSMNLNPDSSGDGTVPAAAQL